MRATVSSTEVTPLSPTTAAATTFRGVDRALASGARLDQNRAMSAEMGGANMKAPPEEKEPSVEQIKLLWDSYAEWSKHLRTWLVAYGIGAPVLFLNRKEIWDIVAASPRGRLIAFLFLGGVTLQIGLATLNKWSSWGYYTSWQWRKANKPRWYPLTRWLVDQFWIDALVDLATLVAFLTATGLTLGLLIPA